MNKINYKIYCRQNLLAVVFFFIVSVMIFAIIFTTNKVIPSIDFKTHYRWLMQYQAALAEGTLYPRWMPLSNLGLGELFYSAYPVYYYLASFFTLGGLEPWSAMKLLGIISNFLAGLITYYGLRTKFGWKAAILTAIFVQSIPFPFFLFTHHAALPWQFSFPLAIALVIQSLVYREQANKFLLALTVAILTLTHVLVAVMTLLCLGVVKLGEVLYDQLSFKSLFLNWALPVLLGIGLVAFHLWPAIIALGLRDPATANDPIYLNWKNSFAFPAITSQIWGTRWSIIQWIFPGVNLLCLTASIYALWRTRQFNSNDLWQLVAKLCLFSVIGLFLASEAAFLLYAYIEPLHALQWPYRFVTISTLGSALGLPLAIVLCYRTKTGVQFCLKFCWFAFSTCVLLLVSLQIQLIREGANPNLTPDLLKGRFRQSGAEFATIGPEWNQYVQRGSFEAYCRSEQAYCEPVLNKTQHRAWTVTTERDARLVLPLFAFPGWTVSIDSEPVSFSIDPPTGLVAVAVPPGHHRLEIELTGLSQARLGAWVSIASLGVLLILSLSSRFREETK